MACGAKINDGYVNLDMDLASRHVLPPLDQF